MHTGENEILLVSCCSVKKVHHRHIRNLQCRWILGFVGWQLVASSRDLFRAVHPDENNAPICLLMYYQVV